MLSYFSASVTTSHSVVTDMPVRWTTGCGELIALQTATVREETILCKFSRTEKAASQYFYPRLARIPKALATEMAWDGTRWGGMAEPEETAQMHKNITYPDSSFRFSI